MRGISARLFALFAALAMLLPGTASARAQYYCRMTGRVIASTSCASKAPPKTASRPQEVQLPDCCQRLSSSHRSAALGTLHAVNDVAPAAWIATLPRPFAIGQSSGRASVCAEPTQAPLALGPPLFVVHCVFLN